ncbi:hypothetical protein QR680_002366 [Steinernema hermaphroditum]|uniref:Nucleosome assembly protein n=1 Tax=Steinernema hermaphroditum TaxID=289476 RepID=A0AA39H2G1_9BILA|nr:hypothetical protein QR680_002366 [Steinernema hermaphroditum]
MLRAGGYTGAEQTPYPEHLAKTTADVRKRVQAVKKLQAESPEYDAINAKRADIVAGRHEPTDAEADVPLLHTMDKEEVDKLTQQWDKENTGSASGIPDFWLNVLRAESPLADMILEHDVPILKNLIDITVSIEDEPRGYVLHFHFQPNEYFSDTVLTKHYQINTDVDEKSPFDYEGPCVVLVKGCVIHWADGKNVTKKVIKKKIKKGASAGKYITKAVKTDSFFNFFDPIPTQVPENADPDDEMHEMIRADFELGQLIRDQIIPRAVHYYTGENVDDEDYGDFDDEDMDVDELMGEE